MIDNIPLCERQEYIDDGEEFGYLRAIRLRNLYNLWGKVLLAVPLYQVEELKLTPALKCLLEIEEEIEFLTQK